MREPSQLTEKQRAIYEYIRERIENRGYGPSIREIGQHFGIKSPNGVTCHIKALIKKGMIRRPEEPLARAIQLVNHRPMGLMLPLLGHVAAGPTIAAEPQNGEFVDFSQFCGPDHFALRVRGNSMIEDHIQDGDYVVIRRQETAANGERVVAMIDGEVTLKRFYRRRDKIVLEPANSDMPPIVVSPDRAIRILGTLVGVLRKC
ncbi:MAG: transcriptional repressor LexA [Gemmataceae bacterium]|nr:transcriptional repressor LexA [Gemmataceae bacterium]